jgi:Mg/Co/Ni transporter MgtE
VIAAAMVINLVVAGLAGTVIPVVLERSASTRRWPRAPS